jgi:hypothetical protein
MTTTTRDKIVCECGHEGYITRRENDQPFSGLWEEYSLNGFDGNELTITSYKNMPKNLLAHLDPKCPECGSVGKVKYTR